MNKTDEDKELPYSIDILHSFMLLSTFYSSTSLQNGNLYIGQAMLMSM
jgi:hypothetical protein